MMEASLVVGEESQEAMIAEVKWMG